MISCQETERVYSVNPRARTGLAWWWGCQSNAHHVVTSPATHHHCPLANSKLCCSVTEITRRTQAIGEMTRRRRQPAEKTETHTRVLSEHHLSHQHRVVVRPCLGRDEYRPNVDLSHASSAQYLNHGWSNLCIRQLQRSNLYESFPPQVMLPHLPALCQIVHYVRYLLLHWILRYEYHKVRMSSWGAAEWHVTSYLACSTRQPTTFCHRTNENKVYDWWTSSLHHSQITSRQKHMPRT